MYSYILRKHVIGVYIPVAEIWVLIAFGHLKGNLHRQIMVLSLFYKHN